MNNNFSIQNILRLIETLGEEKVGQLLSEFSCPINPEIEDFVRNKSIDFAKKKISITYFLIGDNGKIIAIFTLTHKAIDISADSLSASSKKKLSRFAEIDEATGKYTVSAFLIAQFGKNLNPDIRCCPPDGNALMNCVIEFLKTVQRMVGGGVVYLECEDKPALLNFYQNDSNRFHKFDTRLSASDNTSYIQLLRFF